jgi:putative copper export protein
VSELTWTLGSALASALQVVGISLVIGSLGAAWLFRGTAVPVGQVLRIGVLGGAAAVAGAACRAILQSAALAETPGEFATMLRPVLFETSLGSALRLQAIAGALAVVALLAAFRWRRTGTALAALAACALSLAPGLGGHPAAHAMPAFALTASLVHVAGLGLWLGTLAALTWSARTANDAEVATAVQRFHRLAAVGLAAVVATGIAKLIDLRPPVAALLDSTWGVSLLVKLAAFGLVALLGWWHWRRADAAIAEGRRSETVQSFAAELVLALVVVAATSVLINSAPPERAVIAGPPANPERVATRMYREIASPYCPGMSLASCPSEGAFYLKRQIRARLDSIGPDSVMAELAAEFGPEISGITPAQGFGLVAWLAPFVGLGLGAVGIYAWTRRSARRSRSTFTAGVASAAQHRSEESELTRLAEALRDDS